MNAAHLESLLERLERLTDPEARELARTLVAELLRVQGEALARLVELARAAPGGPDLLAAWAGDAQAAGLLLLHGLHPDAPAVRVARAIEGAKEVASFVGVAVRPVRLGRECVLELTAGADVPSSALAELEGQIESAIVAAAPEVASVRFEVSRRLALPLVGRAGP
jgi:hypothetical protein